MNRKNRILVAGTGKSGIAAAKMVLTLGAEVLLYNSDPAADFSDVLTRFAPDARPETAAGQLFPVQLRNISAAVLSPGISPAAEFLQPVYRAGIPVIGELELAYQASRGRICAITGTNGKTTTTSMVGEIMKKTCPDVHVAGNIGVPFTEEALLTLDSSVSVLEVSSFMLETIHEFHPSVSAILNITPDHLDRHKTMDAYIRCKEGITANQTEDDYVVLNYDDPLLRAFGEAGKLRPHVIWFSSRTEPSGEALFLRDGVIFIKDAEGEKKLMAAEELRVIGRHNYENAMAAAAAALKMGVPAVKIAEALRNFRAVEHRIEFVRERCGVKYYNDSKGTNPDAAVQALNAMPGPTLLIGGGYDKHNEYDDWVRLFPGKVKHLVLIGQTRDQISECCRKYGFTEIMYADNMEEAVRACASYADEGDYVLLSPACASWGMFGNYEERGRIFKKCVMEL